MGHGGFRCGLAVMLRLSCLGFSRRVLAVMSRHGRIGLFRQFRCGVVSCGLLYCGRWGEACRVSSRHGLAVRVWYGEFRRGSARFGS